MVPIPKLPDLTSAAAIPATSGDFSPADRRDLALAVSAAVKQLNSAGYGGDGREVVFSFDRATRLPVVRVVDTDTKEVIDQLPTEAALRLADTTVQQEIQDESIF
jgi:flagellar protein FlaG